MDRPEMRGARKGRASDKPFMTVEVSKGRELGLSWREPQWGQTMPIAILPLMPRVDLRLDSGTS